MFLSGKSSGKHFLKNQKQQISLIIQQLSHLTEIVVIIDNGGYQYIDKLYYTENYNNYSVEKNVAEYLFKIFFDFCNTLYLLGLREA